MSKIVIGYWAIRGLVEPARMLLEYGGIDYEDKKYVCGDKPPYDKSIWTDVKFTLGLDFPNLPYLIDGNTKITESWAIYRYIARKAGLVPVTDKEKAECDMLEGVVQSLRSGFTSVCYNPAFASMKDDMKKNQLQKLISLEKFLKGRKHLVGNRLCYIDFVFYETLDHHRMLFNDILDDLPNIKAYVYKMEALEKFKAYLTSGRFHKYPVNNPQSQWGCKAK